MGAKQNLLYLTLFFLLFNIYSSLNVEAEEAADLYSPLDDVIRLNSTTFEPTVFQESKNITFVVQFYNTFCGHCQMFSPIYKSLASRTKNWTSVIRVAGVDCSKDENVITCSENNIMGYPTVFIYPPNPRHGKPEDEPLNLRSLKIEWTVDDIEEALVDYLVNLTKSNRQYPPVIDALQPMAIDKFKDFQRVYPLKNDHDDTINEKHGLQDLMFIIESDKSYLGRKLIIEYYRINSRLELRRIMLSQKELIESILSEDDIKQLEKTQPLLVRANYPEDETRKAQILVKGEINTVLPTTTESERDDFIEGRFKAFLEHYYYIELRESGYRQSILKIHSNDSGSARDLVRDHRDEDIAIQYLIHSDPIGSKKIYAIDLLKGITYMFTHEIKIKGDLSASEFNTVRSMLTILKKYLPLERWDSDLSKFVVDLRTKLDDNRNKYEKYGLKAQEMRDMLELSGADTLRLRYNRENWVSCYDSDKHHKGYTCSLWLLFHSLTVGEYMKSAPVRVRPTMVLFTMRDYITKFLGCSVCSSNFEKETESLDANLSYRNSSALWLWNTHNLVRQRLNNENSIDKKPLAQTIFPSPERCPQCFITRSKEIGADGKSYTDIQWDMRSILEFIVDLYKPDKVVTPIELASLLSKNRGKLSYDLIDGDQFGSKRITSPDYNRSSVQWNIQSIFSTSDMSICLFLYLSCIIIVAVVCVALNPKWTRLRAK